MGSVFDNLPMVDYSSMVASCDPTCFTTEEQKLIKEYKTPNREYISSSSRNVSAEQVGYDTLEYIITNCFKCKIEEKYQAIVVFLEKIYKSTLDMAMIKEAKAELIQYVKDKPTIKINSLDYLDDVTKDIDDNFFYLIKITIGRNILIKYGITDQNPRARFAQIKTDVKANYKKQSVSIDPILIIHCDDSKKFELEIKMRISEADIESTNYTFKGSSETLPKRYELTLIQKIIEPVAEKLKGSFIYTCFPAHYYEL